MLHACFPPAVWAERLGVCMGEEVLGCCLQGFVINQMCEYINCLFAGFYYQS